MCIRSFARSWLISGLVLASLGLRYPVASAAQSGSPDGAPQLKNIKLIALPVAGDGRTNKRKYLLSEPPFVLLSLENQSAQDVPIQIHNRLFQYQLDLRRDGVPIQPRQEIARKLREEVDQSGGFNSVTTLDPIKPNKTASIEVIKLSDWYDQMAVGHYHLTVKYRIANSKQSEISASTDFDVVQ
jgi:hypothetical protein